MSEVLHKLIVRERWGGRQIASLCGVHATTRDGMNLTNDDDEVTCKLCLRVLRRWSEPIKEPK